MHVKVKDDKLKQNFDMLFGYKFYKILQFLLCNYVHAQSTCLTQLFRYCHQVEANPALWLSAVSQSRVRDTFCSYGVMELCTKGLGSSVHTLKARGVSLACVRTCVVVAEERPRIALTTSFSKLFSALGLSPRAVSTSFGCRVNTAICLQVRKSPSMN